MSILDWRKETKKKNDIGGENEMKFAKGYKDRYGIIKEMGEKCDSWKNIDYAVASSKILQAETDLEIECAYEQTRFDKPKKWYRDEDAKRIEELLLEVEERNAKIIEERGETRTEINEKLKAKYGFEINSVTFKRLEGLLGIEYEMVMPKHGGKKVTKYINENYDKLMEYIENNIIPKRAEKKRAEVKVYNKYDELFEYIQNKVNGMKTRITELENEVKEKDHIIEDLRQKSMQSTFDRIKKMFGE